MHIYNEILLRRAKKLNLKENSTIESPERINKMIAVMLREFENLGFLLNEELVKILKTYEAESLKIFYMDLLKELKRLVGADVKYEPMYPNFPQQVIEMDEFELYLNAIIHYATFGQLLPEYEKEERFPLLNKKTHTIIYLAKDGELETMMKNIAGAKTSISQQDRQDYEDIFKYLSDSSDIADILPKEIYMKENLVFVCNLGIKYKVEAGYLSEYIKTSTDILRLATEMSGGDYSLSSNSKFKTFSRPERRFLLNLLECIPNYARTEGMIRHKNKWIRLGEKLSPGDYKNKFPKTHHSFSVIRNNEKFETFSQLVEEEMKKKIENSEDFVKLVDIIKKRPTELLRRFVALTNRTTCYDTKQYLLASLKEVVDKIPFPTLLQTAKFFESMEKKEDYRAFFPKGLTSKIYVKNEEKADWGADYSYEVNKICLAGLYKHLEGKDSLGKVYIDRKLENYLVPFSQSASSAFKTYVRGSQIPISDDCKVIRLFVYWANAPFERVDLDLSAGFLGSDFKHLEHVSWTNLKTCYSYHSGDITNAPNGAAEFIDIDLEKIKLQKPNAKYVTFNVFSWTKQEFKDLDVSYFGFMEREDLNSGEIFEPSTVSNKVNLESKVVNSIPMIYDIYNRKIIYADINYKSMNLHNMIENRVTQIQCICKFVNDLKYKKPNLYELFSIHMDARGGVFEKNIGNADIIFTTDETYKEKIEALNQATRQKIKEFEKILKKEHKNLENEVNCKKVILEKIYCIENEVNCKKEIEDTVYGAIKPFCLNQEITELKENVKIVNDIIEQHKKSIDEIRSRIDYLKSGIINKKIITNFDIETIIGEFLG